VQSVTAVLEQYGTVLATLEDISHTTTSEMATKVSGLLDRLVMGRHFLASR